MGPVDVIGDSGAGILSDDLREAALAALDIPRDVCRSAALSQSWAVCTDQFLENAATADAMHRQTGSDV
jgi:hypothetical protein